MNVYAIYLFLLRNLSIAIIPLIFNLYLWYLKCFKISVAEIEDPAVADTEEGAVTEVMAVEVVDMEEIGVVVVMGMVAVEVVVVMAEVEDIVQVVIVDTVEAVRVDMAAAVKVVMVDRVGKARTIEDDNVLAQC